MAQFQVYRLAGARLVLDLQTGLPWAMLASYDAFDHSDVEIPSTW